MLDFLSYDLVSPRLANCNISNESCSSLASTLTSPTSCLKQLDLSANKLQDLGVECLCSALKHPNCKLEKLL